MHVEVRPLPRADAWAHFLEVGRSWKRCQYSEASLIQAIPINKLPEHFEVALAPCRIDHEVASDTILQAASDFNRGRRVVDGRVLHKSFEPIIRGCLEPEKNIEVPCDRPPCFQQRVMTRNEV